VAQDQAYWGFSSACPETREIWTTQITTEMEYLAALHEIGHVHFGTNTFDQAEQVIWKNEVEAWDWALSEAEMEIERSGNAEFLIYSRFLGYQEKAPDAVLKKMERRLPYRRGGTKQMRFK
jgi:hypothetical protein